MRSGLNIALERFESRFKATGCQFEDDEQPQNLNLTRSRQVRKMLFEGQSLARFLISIDGRTRRHFSRTGPASARAGDERSGRRDFSPAHLCAGFARILTYRTTVVFKAKARRHLACPRHISLLTLQLGPFGEQRCAKPVWRSATGHCVEARLVKLPSLCDLVLPAKDESKI